MANVVSMPKLGFDMAEGVLIRWVKSEGEKIKKGEVLAEIETDKATVEVESEFNGIIFRLLVNPDDIVPVGEPIAVIAENEDELNTINIENTIKSDKTISIDNSKFDKEEKSDDLDMNDVAISSKEEEKQQEILRASPLAKRIAKEKNIDLMDVIGTGPLGRVVKQDVETYLERKIASSDLILKRSSIKRLDKDNVESINRLRSAIGKRMQESKSSIPHFYITHKYVVKKLIDFRKDINNTLEDNKKISLNDFFVKAVSLGLQQFPNLNSQISGNKLIKYASINIGIAVAVDNGLLTIVCRNADQKSIFNISNEIKEMVERVHAGKVKADDIEGSTFSISNLGMYDVDDFVAIINPPEAAILAIGSAKEEPIVRNGEIISSITLKMTMSADHRITDGAEVAQFLNYLEQYMNNPVSLLL